MRWSQARGALGIFRLYYPRVIADRRTVRCDFCFRFSRSVLSLLLVPKKAASAAGSEAGMDCGTALAKQARLHPYREALRRRILARPRAPTPAAAGRVGEKSGSQFGVARKPLKRLDSRKKEAWISLPLALNFLPNDLDFPSPGFANPSTHFSKYSRFTWNSPAASRAHRAPRGPARRPYSARDAPAGRARAILRRPGLCRPAIQSGGLGLACPRVRPGTMSPIARSQIAG